MNSLELRLTNDGNAQARQQLTDVRQEFAIATSQPFYGCLYLKTRFAIPILSWIALIQGNVYCTETLQTIQRWLSKQLN